MLKRRIHFCVIFSFGISHSKQLPLKGNFILFSRRNRFFWCYDTVCSMPRPMWFQCMPNMTRIYSRNKVSNFSKWIFLRFLRFTFYPLLLPVCFPSSVTTKSGMLFAFFVPTTFQVLRINVHLEFTDIHFKLAPLLRSADIQTYFSWNSEHKVNVKF